MSISVIIVDDEPLARTLLRSILDEIEDVDVVAQCANGYEALDAIIAHQPDVMFLDIHMPGLNGFDVIARIQSHLMPVVIFTTAYADYAIKAFSVQAIDYVLKPIEDNKVFKSVARAREAINSGYAKNSEYIARDKPKLLSVLQPESHKDQDGHPMPQSGAQPSGTLIVKENDTIARLNTQSIYWIEAAGDYVCIHTEGATRLVRATLKSIEDDIDARIFQRIHRSTIINMNYLKSVTRGQKGEAIVEMQDGARLKVSRKYGTPLRSRLN